MHLVERIVLTGLCGAEIGIHGRNAGVAGHIVEPELGDLHDRRLLAYVEQQTGRTHGRESAGGNHVDLLGRADLAFLLDDLDHLLGIDHHGLAFSDTIIDFRDRLVHLMLSHMPSKGCSSHFSMNFPIITHPDTTRKPEKQFSRTRPQSLSGQIFRKRGWAAFAVFRTNCPRAMCKVRFSTGTASCIENVVKSTDLSGKTESEDLALGIF